MLIDGIDLNRGCLPFRFAPPARNETNHKVPPYVHLIWIGSSVPERYLNAIEILREHNPGFVFLLWTDDEMFGFRNQDLIDSETNLGAKADLVRYELVHRFGGIYLDVDHDSLGPGSLHPDMRNSFVQVSGAPWYNTTNSDFGFAAHSEFLDYVIRMARDPRVRAMHEVPERTGPTFFTTCVVSFGDPSFVRSKGWVGLEKLHHRGDHNWR